jgi:translation elongation factor EF-1beta
MFDISPVTHPYVFAWFNFVVRFNPLAQAQWPADSGASAAGQASEKKGGKKGKKEEKPADDDLDDLFGDDNEDDGAAAKAIAEAAKNKGKKEKKVVIAQSLVLFEVKPIESDTDLDALAKRILDITGDGIYWKTEYKKEPVAFGIFKLVIGVTVEDDKVSVDDL